MRSNVIRISGLLAAMGLAAGLSFAHHDEPAPSTAPVEVTYYYLSG